MGSGSRGVSCAVRLRESEEEARLIGAGLAGFAGFAGLGDCASFTSYSINLPPPPGPPGTYLRFFSGGPSLASLPDPLGDDLEAFLDGLPGVRFFAADAIVEIARGKVIQGIRANRMKGTKKVVFLTFHSLSSSLSLKFEIELRRLRKANTTKTEHNNNSSAHNFRRQYSTANESSSNGGRKGRRQQVS